MIELDWENEKVCVLYFMNTRKGPVQELAGADPGFRKRGFICKKVWRGFVLLMISIFFLNIPGK